MKKILFLFLIFLPFTSALSAWSKWILPSPLKTRRDYALFFAVNDYQPGSGFDDLSKPIENAEAVARELRERYGFQAEVVKNPTLDQISAKLEEYKAFFAKNPQGKYPSSGQLLIYFTGHGISEDNNGYFVPSNGDIKKLYSTTLAYEIWRPKINKIDCRHILVAIDACYSVTFDPDWYNKKMDPGAFKRPGELSEGDKLLLANETDKCRIVFSSDGEEDKVPERSNFARKFIEGLQAGPRQDGILTSEGLAAYLRFAAPKPRLTEFGDDQKGSFLFVQVAAYSAADAAKKAAEAAGAASLEKDLAAWRVAKTANTIAAFQEYLSNFPAGDFREQADAAIRTIEQDLTIRRDNLSWEVAVEKNTLEAFKKYLTDYPNGRHFAEAKTKIKTLEQSKDGNSVDGLLLVKGGTFTMGCTSEQRDCKNDEVPTHTVVVDDFYIGKYEVTQAEWRKVMGDDLLEFNNKGCDQCPVDNVSWNDVQEFLRKLNTQTGIKYRLPTEAEWEYAARGGNLKRDYLFSGSNDLDDVAWYNSNYLTMVTHGNAKTTHPVGSKEANELGLYDMSGNVSEWCKDWYGNYPSVEQSNPSGPISGINRTIRGGSWTDAPEVCRVTRRYGLTPQYRVNFVGFRLARSK
jgi:formylglycine-generating enzyme required for sulfatase activity